MNKCNHEKLDEIVRAIRKARSETTDLLELVVGHTEQWPVFRSKILKCFGDRGLEGTVREILDGHSSDEGHCNE